MPPECLSAGVHMLEGQPRRRLRFGAFDLSNGPSGLSRYLIAILNALDCREFEVVLFDRAHGPYRGVENVRHVTVRGDEGPCGSPPLGLAAGRQDRRIDRHAWRRFAPAWLKQCGGFLRDSRRLHSLFRQNPVDILYFPISGYEPAAVAARRAGVTCVTGTFHTEAPCRPLHERLLERWAARCMHGAIAVSEATRQDWLRRTGIVHDRVVTVPNGIDPHANRRRLSREEARRELGLPPDRVVVVGVGRLAPMKGFSRAVDALAILDREFPMLTLAIAGDGPLKDDLERQVRSLGLEGRVFLLGWRGDVSPVYDAADVFLLSSVSAEAAPYVVLEAMAHELPVVAARVGGVAEIVLSGETGYVVPAGDPGALAAALRPLLSSAELRIRLGTAGRERVAQHFCEDEMVRRTIDVYREMLGTGKR